jgi:hypothetical protein
MDEVSAHCRSFRVSADVFQAAKRSAAKWRGLENGRSHGYFRCLARAKHRGLLLCPGRYAEHRGLWILLFWVAHARSRRSRQFPIRRNEVERPRSLRSGSCSGVKRSEIWRVRPCAGQTVPMLGTKCKYRLGAAGFRSDHQLSAVRGARQRPVAPSNRFSDEVLVPALARMRHGIIPTGGLARNQSN